MTTVITTICVGVKDKGCLPVCPMDCIYEGERQLYIHPDQCIDCGACQPACPVGAIFLDVEVPEKYRASIQENADFFRNGLPGSTEPAKP
ncbi:MAG TPA: ferredoxin family protein [Planctomycetota bacterium]|jgi:NAD-dependent dihydropyrimidine dehydrogenase PreA subunit|nr:ferredoxin family protein [Planctomycetota bacterium]